MKRPLVIIESPYAGNVELNIRYARACVADSIRRGERPFASHLFYTQEGILDDSKPEDRQLGISLGYAFWDYAELIVFYMDLGMSPGMEKAYKRAARGGRYSITRRKLEGWTENLD